MQTQKIDLDLILDSGAYTAWSMNEKINIEDYIIFIKKYQNFNCGFNHIVNLDVIPAKPGVKPTKKDIEISAQKSYENLKYLEKQGIKAMPVFHQDENFHWLEKLIKEGYDYIGISPANDRVTKQKIAWLDEVFTKICDNKGVPIIKTHSFGATAIEVLWRYPWTSADSSTWTRAGRYGSVLIPDIIEGQYSYRNEPLWLCVSKTSITSNGSSRLYRHFESFGKKEQTQFLKYFIEKGYTHLGLINSWKYRDMINMQYYLDLEKAINTYGIKTFTKKHLPKKFFE